MFVLISGIAMWGLAGGLFYSTRWVFLKLRAPWLMRYLLAVASGVGAVCVFVAGTFQFVIFFGCELWNPAAHIACV